MATHQISVELVPTTEGKDDAFDVTVNVNDDLYTVRRTLQDFKLLDAGIREGFGDTLLAKDEALVKTLSLPETDEPLTRTSPTDFSAYLRAVVAQKDLALAPPVTKFLGDDKFFDGLRKPVAPMAFVAGLDEPEEDAEDENPSAAAPHAPPPVSVEDLSAILRASLETCLKSTTAPSSSGALMRVGLVPYTPDAVYPVEDFDTNPTAPSPTTASRRVAAMQYVGAGFASVPPTPVSSPCGSPCGSPVARDAIKTDVNVLTADENPSFMFSSGIRAPANSPVAAEASRKWAPPSATELSGKLADAAAAGLLRFVAV